MARSLLKEGEKQSTNMAISSVTMENNNVTLLHEERSRSFYTLGEIRPTTEGRMVEHKKGGGNYLKKYFQKDVAKYACAFLNSAGGTLVIGVQNDGIVFGVSLPRQREDQVKLQIDDIMKGFIPPVFTESYSLKVVPVKSPQLDTMQPDLKVVEIKFQPHYQRGGLLSLYVSNNEQVYVKRDASIQGPLKPSLILAWSTPKIYDLVVTMLEYQYQEKIAELKEKEIKLYDENNVLKSNNNTLTDLLNHSSSQTNNHNSAIVTKHPNKPDNHLSYPKEHEENKRSEEEEKLLERNKVLDSENAKLNHELTTAFQHNLTPTPEVCADIEALVSFFEAKDKDTSSIESELQPPTPTPAFCAYMKTLVSSAEKKDNISSSSSSIETKSADEYRKNNTVFPR